jgi:hypothetical protein
MIPYDDLVAALSAWRARQGLPVSTMGGGGSGATAAAPGSGPHAQPGSGPTAKPGSGPTRSAPPAPPSGRHNAVPPPLALGDEMQEVDETALLEEQYENEGQDFAMSFGGNQASDDSQTAIGNTPGEGRGGRSDRDDW